MTTLADYGPEVRAEVKQVRQIVSDLHQQLLTWHLVVWTAGNVSQGNPVFLPQTGAEASFFAPLEDTSGLLRPLTE